MATRKIPPNVQTLFSHFDDDHDGFIELAKLTLVLEGAGGVPATQTERERTVLYEELQPKFDPDGDGLVSIGDFYNALLEYAPDFCRTHDDDPDIPPRIREIFSKLDEDNSGYLESAEIGRILQMMGITDSEERDDQADALQSVLDADGDGRITIKEFSIAAKQLGLLDRTATGGSAPRAHAGGNGFEFEASTVHKEEVFGDSSDDDHSPQAVVTTARSKGAYGRPLPERSATTPAAITDDKRVLLWKYFSAADEDGGGSIGIRELKHLLTDEDIAGPQAADKRKYITDSYVRKIMKILDTSGDENLDFDEFCTAFHTMFSDSGKTVEHSLHAAEKDALLEAVKRFEAERDEKINDYSALQQAYDRSRKENDEQIAKAQEEFESYREHIVVKNDFLDRENKKFKIENHELKSRIEYLESQMTDIREENRQLRRGSIRTTTTNDSDEGFQFEIRRLAKELERAQHDNAMLQSQRQEEADFFAQQLRDYDARVAKIFDDLKKMPELSDGQKYLIE